MSLWYCKPNLLPCVGSLSATTSPMSSLLKQLVFRISAYLQAIFINVSLWKEKITGGYDLEGNRPFWAKEGFILKEWLHSITWNWNSQFLLKPHDMLLRHLSVYWNWEPCTYHNQSCWVCILGWVNGSPCVWDVGRFPTGMLGDWLCWILDCTSFTTSTVLLMCYSLRVTRTAFFLSGS